jgi:hypothetical protein
MKKVRSFQVHVTYTDTTGAEREETFPVWVEDYSTAKSTALNYIVQILRLNDFELRLVGA